MRFQSQVFTDWSVHNDPETRRQQLAGFKLYLDECAMAGVYVLLVRKPQLFCAILYQRMIICQDRLATNTGRFEGRPLFIILVQDSGIDPLAIAGFNGTQGTAWTELVGNLSLVNTHPAFGGYYGCDDCCHMGAKNAIFFEFPLCLSRACLVKMIAFIYKWLNGVFSQVATSTSMSICSGQY